MPDAGGAEEWSQTREGPQRLIFGRLYFDQPNEAMNIPSSINGLPVAYMPSSSYWFDFDDTFELTDYAVLSHSRLLDDQLSILLGARHDSYDEHLTSYRRGPNNTDVSSDESDDGATYSAGRVYYFNWLGIFANYSKNIRPPNAGSQPLLSRPLRWLRQRSSTQRWSITNSPKSSSTRTYS